MKKTAVIWAVASNNYVTICVDNVQKDWCNRIEKKDALLWIEQHHPDVESLRVKTQVEKLDLTFNKSKEFPFREWLQQ